MALAASVAVGELILHCINGNMCSDYVEHGASPDLHTTRSERIAMYPVCTSGQPTSTDNARTIPGQFRYGHFVRE
jgi:hypothetical protein